MTDHLRLVRDDPPDLDDDEDGDDGGGDLLAVDISITSEVHYGSRVIVDAEDASPEVIAMAVLAACRGVVAAYGNRDVSMAFERLLLEQWGTPDGQ